MWNTGCGSGRWLVLAAAAVYGLGARSAHAAAPPYGRITPTQENVTVTLTGHDLTIEQVMQIARYGAKASLSAEAKQREENNHGMMLEAQAEGVPVYMLNRGGGLGRANIILQGDPLSPENKAILERRELAAFEQGSMEGDGPEIAEEEIVRATMVTRANEMVFEAPSAQLAQMLLDFLNDDITPVMQSRGTVGESDLYVLANINGAMVGKGDVYYHGIRMAAAQALRQARLAPLKPFALDSSTLANSNGYTAALAVFLVVEGRQALDWTDLTDALDLNGMNGSITPLSMPVQLKRPDKWLNWDASRILQMLKGGYLFNDDPQRMLADADSLRASSIRQGSAWAAWAQLRDSVLMQINSSDHNPVVNVGLSPQDSWELSTPQMMKYYVKGGKYSNGQHGYVISSANWDPYPMVNHIESFTNALANVGVVVTQRIYRFDNPFFTVAKAADLVHADDSRRVAPQGNGTLVMNLWQELQILAVPVPAEGVSTDFQGNGDIESQALIKVQRSRQAVDVMFHLLGQDLLTGTYWMNVRKLQDPGRSFGSAPDAVLSAFRGVVPWETARADLRNRPAAKLSYEYVKSTPIAVFFPQAADEPRGRVQIPRADADPFN